MSERSRQKNRQARLAAALRENLRRRKAQARARSITVEAGQEPDPPMPTAPDRAEKADE